MNFSPNRREFRRGRGSRKREGEDSRPVPVEAFTAGLRGGLLCFLTAGFNAPVKP